MNILISWTSFIIYSLVFRLLTFYLVAASFITSKLSSTVPFNVYKDLLATKPFHASTSRMYGAVFLLMWLFKYFLLIDITTESFCRQITEWQILGFYSSEKNYSYPNISNWEWMQTSITLCFFCGIFWYRLTASYFLNLSMSIMPSSSISESSSVSFFYLNIIYKSISFFSFYKIGIFLILLKRPFWTM